MAEIGHEHIVSVLDIGTAPGGSLYFVMEHLRGEDLADTLAREGRLPWLRVRSIGLQLCLALAASHDKRIIHRDLKPPNCFMVTRLDGGDYVKILDFGIAKVLAPEGRRLTDPRGMHRVDSRRWQHTITGEVFGTMAYMSPEHFFGEQVDHRTDIYALGVILYEMLGGEHPFGARGEVTLHARLLGSAIRPLSERAPDLPPAVLELVAGCLAAAPADRFASAGELGRRIDRCMREAGWRVSEYELSELVAQIGAAAASTPVAPHPFDLALGVELARVEGGAGGPAAFTSTPFNTVLERGPREPAAPDAHGPRVRPQPEPVRTSLTANAAPTRGAGPRRRRSVALIVAASLALLLGLGYLAAERRDTPPTANPVAPRPSTTARVGAAQRALRHVGPARAATEPGGTAVARAATDRAEGGGPSAQDQPAPVPRTQAASGAARRPLARLRAPRGRQRTEAVAPVPMGTLSVNSEPWAVVFVDDVRLRSTPLLGHSLAAGSHRVRLEHPPRQWTATREVVIRAGEETRLSVELGP